MKGFVLCLAPSAVVIGSDAIGIVSEARSHHFCRRDEYAREQDRNQEVVGGKGFGAPECQRNLLRLAIGARVCVVDRQSSWWKKM